MSDWNAPVIDEFRNNEGRIGGNFEGAPMLLLHTTGAKTGHERVNPMMYLRHDDRLLVFASKAGMPTNPDWYHNLVANPDVTVELGTETFAATAMVTTGDDRDRLFAIQAERYPGFKEYEAKTDRVIPVVELIRKD
jgi:deazaflavin-dependent oxidoreductase (nitroreductase family)